jgi:4-hydroxybenzoate polyprenyltransferase
MAGIACILGMWEANAFIDGDLDFKFFLTSFLGFLLGFTLSGGLNAFNDILDYDIDKDLKPERTLPRGQLSIFQVKVLVLFLLSLGVLLTLLLYIPILIVVIGLIILGLLYSIYLQNIPLVKNIIVAFSLSNAILIGSWIIIKDLPFSDIKITLLVILTFFSILLFEIHKDIGDIHVDYKFGKRTIPIILGSKNAALSIYIGYWLIVLLFWSYLAIFESAIKTMFLIIIQSILLIKSSSLLGNQSSENINKTRKIVYSIFGITLLFLFPIME